jgi:hypothetical protein
MSDQPLLAQRVLPAAAHARAPRVEYVDFKDLDEHREYRFRVYGTEGSSEIRMRIANAAFTVRSVRRQDGADVCYQKLLRTIAAVETPPPGVITIEDVDLFSYRDDHTPVPKRRSYTPASPAAPVSEPRRSTPYRPRTPRVVSPRLPVAEVVPEEVGPTFEEGQRVNHAIFGIGVTTTSTRARTVIAFDRDGSKTFVTSLLEVEVLSAPHTWETGPRGTNRPCKTPAL